MSTPMPVRHFSDVVFRPTGAVAVEESTSSTAALPISQRANDNSASSLAEIVNSVDDDFGWPTPQQRTLIQERKWRPLLLIACLAPLMVVGAYWLKSEAGLNVFNARAPLHTLFYR